MRSTLRNLQFLGLALIAGCVTGSPISEEDGRTGREDTSDESDTTEAMDADVQTDADVTSPDADAVADVDVTPPGCGDGVVQTGEECDLGDGNSDEIPDTCRSNCSNPTCGDGVRDGGEQCDDANSDETDGCTATCTAFSDQLCLPCANNAQCGSGNLCMRLADSNVCGLTCRSNGDCPDGFDCAEVSSTEGGTGKQCVPTSGACIGCFDPDRDTFGTGPECAGPDCDQTNPDVHPGVFDECGGIDNDCDGAVDEDAPRVTYYADADRDGAGDPENSVSACSPPANFVANSNDCDDTNAQTYAGAAELCDGLDNNCSGGADEGASTVSFYPDDDGDGFGDASAAAEASCEPISGKVTNNRDCDDTNSLVSPSETELCTNLADENCDAAIDCEDSTCSDAPACAVDTCADDALEENDSPEAPRAIGAGTLAALVACSDDADFYSVSLAAGDAVSASISFQNSAGDVDLFVRDSVGRTLVQSTGTGNSEEVEYLATESGTYLVVVTLYSDAGEPGSPYDLVVELSEGASECRDDLVEENDTFATASALPEAPLTGLVSCTGDSDFFFADLGVGDEITVRVEYSSAEGDIDLALVNDVGTALDESTAVTGVEEINFVAGTAGRFAARVFLYSDSGSTSGAAYSISSTIERAGAACADDRFEENDTLPTASPLALGSLNSLVACMSDRDYYSLFLNVGDEISIDLRSSAADGDVDLYLVNTDDIAVAGSNSTFGNEFIRYTISVAGEYYVAVLPYSDLGDAGVAYSLTVDVVEPVSECTSDAQEPNDSPDAASPIDAGLTSNLRACEGDDDYFAVELVAGQSIAASITFSSSEADVELALLGPTGTLVDLSVGTTGNEEVSADATSSGTYLLRVYVSSADPAGAAYSLSLEIADVAVCDDDTNEPDDDTIDARPYSTVPPGGRVVCPTDLDFSEVNLAAGETVIATASFSNSQGDIDLRLEDSIGRILDQSVTSGNSETVEYTATSSGAYFVVVQLYSDTGALGNTYTLDVNIDRPVACANDANEPNNELLDANIVDPGLISNQTVCTGDEDYFSYGFNTGDELTITLTFDSAEADLDVELLDVDGFFLDGSYGIGSTEEITFTTPTSGIHYVHVTMASDRGEEGAAYSLRVESNSAATTLCPADDRYEENDTSIAAVDLGAGLVSDLAICSEFDSDFFAFSLQDGDILDILVSFRHAEGDIDVQLLDDALDSLAFGSSSDDDESIFYIANGPETVYLELVLFEDFNGGGVEYSLDVNIN